MPYLFVKGHPAHVSPTHVVANGREKDVRKQLQIPDNVAQTEHGFTLSKTPLVVLDALEMKGWKVVNAVGPEAGSGLYVWTFPNLLKTEIYTYLLMLYRMSSLKKTASAGTPVPESPVKAPPAEAGPKQTTVRREERRKGSTHRGGSTTKTASKGSDEKAKKGSGGSGGGGGGTARDSKRLELTKKMTAAEYDKFCETECEMWVPCGRYKTMTAPRKFVIPAGRLFKAETRADDVPILPSTPILNELTERTKKYTNRSAKGNKSKQKKLRKIKSSVDDKFTQKKD